MDILFTQSKHVESWLQKKKKKLFLLFQAAIKHEETWFELKQMSSKKQATNYSYPGKKHIQPDLTGLLKVSEAEIWGHLCR